MKTKFRMTASGTGSGIGAAVALALAVAVVAPVAVPVAHAQQADGASEARLRKIEAEIRALQRKVFPDGAGRTFGPEITATPQPSAPAAPAEATTPLTDVLARLDTVESQLRQITASTEENQNHLSKLDTRVSALESAAAPQAPADGAQGAGAPLAGPSTPARATSTAPAPARSGAAPAATRPASVAATPAARTAASADRVAAVAAIEKPSTGDKAEDEYSYGFRLYDAKFYPEAQAQLTKFVQAYPKSSRISYARNLLGRAYLDDGKPGTAAQWFLQNYLGDKQGARASESLLNLGVAMTRIKDTKRACGAFGELRDTYPDDVAGRLKGQYEAAIKGVKCN